MVASRLRDRGDLVPELNGRHEAFELVLLRESHVAVGVFDHPAVEPLQELADLVARERGSARLAFHAVTLVERLGLGRHGMIVSLCPPRGEGWGVGRRAESSGG